MDVSLLLLAGIMAAIFVGFNIGGSSTGVAWGPAVGAGLIKKSTAAAIMTFFVFLGGWTVGRNVMDTLSDDIITTEITLQSGVAILTFIGLGILLANIYGVPVPTSMVTVGAISGLGLATGTLRWDTIGWIVTWWVLTPIIGFWIGAIIGRYLYPYLDQRFHVAPVDGPLFHVDRSHSFPRLHLSPDTTRQEMVGTAIVIIVACYMAFSAGASNVPNAVAPLVSEGAIERNPAILIGTLAIGLGGFTIARRTMESVGTELSDISLLAAVIVMTTAATITTFLSYIGIPISLVMGTVMTIVGLGWGRATRSITGRDVLTGDIDTSTPIGALTVDTPEEIPAIGESEPQEVLEATALFDPQVVAKFVSMWIIGPSVALGLSFGFFSLLFSLW